MEKNIETFTVHGIPSHLAKTLIYISQFDECKISDIEKGTKLRQPEVSIAMQELRKRGWVKKRDLKEKGKGRPVHIYSIKSISEILMDVEQGSLKEVANIKSDIDQLKELILKQKSKTKREKISKPVLVKKGGVKMKIDKMDENVAYLVKLKGKDFSVQKKENGNISIYEVFK